MNEAHYVPSLSELQDNAATDKIFFTNPVPRGLGMIDLHATSFIKGFR